MDFNPLIPIGTKIKVDKSKIENIKSIKILEKLPQIICGKIIDYKMTDGVDIGYVLITENNIKIWVFNNELDEQTKKEYNIEIKSRSENILSKELIIALDKVNYELNGTKKIKTLLNPSNLIGWMIFTLKDIF
tara:strand:+ start:381 stop:779 length:399 start_codon:yes stop_codon:yes gene_type:complete